MSSDTHETENKPGREVQFSTSLGKLSQDWKEQSEGPAKPRPVRFFLFLYLTPLLYFLSAGPVGAVLSLNGRPSETSLAIYRCVYYPITVLLEHPTPLTKPLRAYLSLWGV